MVDGDEQVGVLVAGPDELAVQERAAGVVEGEPVLGPGQPVELAGAQRVGLPAQVGHVDLRPPRPVNDLDGLPVPDRMGGAQHLVPADHLAQRGQQRPVVERAVNRQNRCTFQPGLRWCSLPAAIHSCWYDCGATATVPRAPVSPEPVPAPSGTVSARPVKPSPPAVGVAEMSTRTQTAQHG